MAQGSKYTTKQREAALALLATEDNLTIVAEKTGIPKQTLSNWRKKARGDGAEFAERRKYQTERFIDKAWAVQHKALALLDRELDLSLGEVRRIERVIELVRGDDELTEVERRRILDELGRLRRPNMGEIARVLATVYDKGALADDRATENISALGNELRVNIAVVDQTERKGAHGA